MRWILLFLLISCTDTEEMKLFQTSLTSQSGTPILPIDGGESVYLTPDASGGEVGHGFTCTGLYFHKWNNGNPQFWVGNDGREQEPPHEPQDNIPSVVLLELAYDNIDNGYPVTFHATKVKELLTESIQDSSIQGVVEANDGTIWFASGGNIINIENSADGNAVEISRFSVSATGLAYDDVNDELIAKIGSDGVLKRYSTSGVYLGDSITVNNNIDQMNCNTSQDLFYGGLGSNGGTGSVDYYRFSDGTYLGRDSYPNVQASEGVCLVYNPDDGKEYLYYASDGWFHQPPITNPDLKINAIFKRIKTVVTE